VRPRRKRFRSAHSPNLRGGPPSIGTSTARSSEAVCLDAKGAAPLGPLRRGPAHQHVVGNTDSAAATREGPQPAFASTYNASLASAEVMEELGFAPLVDRSMTNTGRQGRPGRFDGKEPAAVEVVCSRRPRSCEARRPRVPRGLHSRGRRGAGECYAIDPSSRGGNRSAKQAMRSGSR